MRFNYLDVKEKLNFFIIDILINVYFNLYEY